MPHIYYIDRLSGKKEKELIFGERGILLLYGDSLISRLFRSTVSPLLTNYRWFSRLYGWWQKRPMSRYKIDQFITRFQINTDEFLEPTESFHSFNDFFIRKLKPGARSIPTDPRCAIIPADGRYLFYPFIDRKQAIQIKGKSLTLETLVQNDTTLIDRYQGGSVVIARLCPHDYHRFHFPCDCIPSQSTKVPGPFDSVNPLALFHNVNILGENERSYSSLKTSSFGDILYIEVGALCVGTIQQTYLPSKPYKKGDEKGFFEFGGSTLILIFEKDLISFDQDLLEATKKGLEIRCLMGQSMGRSTHEIPQTSPHF